MGATAKIAGGTALIAAGIALEPYSGGTSTFLITAGASIALGGVAQALSPKPALPSTPELPGQSLQASVPPELVVYGRCRIQGTPVYFRYFTQRRKDNPDREFLSRVYAITRRKRLDALEGLYVDGTYVPLVVHTGWIDYFPTGHLVPARHSKFDGFFCVHFEPGDGSAGVDQWLIDQSGGEWTADHIGTDVAYAEITTRFSAELFASAPPAVELVVRGFRVFDPRTGQEAWSANAGLCWNDWVTGPFGPGGGVDTALVGVQQLVAAANVCDEAVTLKAGGAIQRYECHGFMDATQPADTIEEALLAAMAGVRVKAGASWLLHAGAAGTPVMDLAPDDRAGPLTIKPRRQRSELFNQVTAIFKNAASDWKGDTTPDRVSYIYRDEDKGAILPQELQLDFVSSSNQAQRLCKIALEQNRRQITWQAAFKPRAGLLEPKEVITYTDAAYGWDKKRFELTSYRAQDGVIQLGLAEYDDLVWVWDPQEEILPDDTALPDQGLSAVAPLLLDIPAFRTSDVGDFGFYAGFRATTPGKRTVTARLWRGSGSQGAFALLRTMPLPTVAGTCLTVLPAGARFPLDRRSTVDVALDQDWDLASLTELQLAGWNNLAWVGRPGTTPGGFAGEVLQFENAVNLVGTTWRLSGLRRGLLGSEGLIGLHGSGEVCVLLNSRLARVDDDAAQLDRAQAYILAMGSEPDPVAAFTFANHGLGRRCPAPAAVRLMTAADGSGDLRLSWSPRPRGGWYAWPSEPYAAEPRLSFWLQLPDLPDKADIEVTDRTYWDYPAVAQEGDFGDVQTALRVRLAQRSEGFGRGDDEDVLYRVSGTF